MAKTSTARSLRNANDPSKAGRGEPIAYRQLLDQLRAQVPFAEALVITSLPRGSLQIAQPLRVGEALLKSYSKGIHAEDRLTWQAIARGEAIRGTDAWGQREFESSRFLKEYLVESGLRHAAAAPLRAPVMDGYPGAIHLYRGQEQGPFTDAELRQIRRFANELDTAVDRSRASRPLMGPCNTALRHKAPIHQIIFDSKLRPQLWGAQFEKLDERLREAILDHARQRLEHVNGKQVLSDRVPLADSRGDLWNFRVVVHRSYPALGDGPIIFFCQQPDCEQWGVLRPTDFQADGEISRLVPALKFMREHFSKGITLVGIAKTIHLSPFHFHRRFTELLGITPKHFLLDCQIEEAKRMLVAQETDLVDIANACGFAHQSHFTSRFKQATGLTPTRWRRLALESQKPSAN